MATIRLPERDKGRLAKGLRGIHTRPAEARELSSTVRSEEVGDEDRNGLVGSDAPQEFQRGIQVRAAALRFVEQNLTDDAEDMATAFARGHEFLDLISEEDQPDFVVITDGGEGEDRAN